MQRCFTAPSESSGQVRPRAVNNRWNPRGYVELASISERKEIMEKINGGYLSPTLPLRLPLHFPTAFRRAPSHRTLCRPRCRCRTSSPAVSWASYRSNSKVAHRARQGSRKNGDIRPLRTQKVQDFTMGQCRSVFLLSLPFLPFLNDRCCSASKRNFSQDQMS